MKAVDKGLHYRVTFVLFRYCWDWRTCPLYGIEKFCISGVLHICKSFQIEQNIINGCFSGVSVGQGSTV